MHQSIVLINAIIYEENQIIPNGFIMIHGMKIKETGWMSQYKADEQSNVIDLQGQVVIPGMIDIHIHGTSGADVMDGEIASLETIVKALPQEGTTAFLATTMTQSDDNISKALKNTANFIKNYQKPGQSEILGVHLEGPFINPSMAGAQPVPYIILPDIPLFERWQKLAEGSIKLVTMAPEQKGGLEFIRYLKQSGVVISIGHSDARFTDVKKSVEAGVTQVTHLYNQMKGMHHREPGVVGAALLLEDLYAELIVDGIHVCPEMIQLAYRNKQSEKLILITDAMRAKCLKNGEYDLGGQLVSVQDGMAVLQNGALAGSVLKLNDAMKNMLHYCNECNLVDVIKMTSTNPAKQLNISDRKGSIRVGKDADLVVLSKEYDVLMTFCRGVLSYQKEDGFCG